MVSLSNNDVIQIDATVIVGVLILITFQFVIADDFSIGLRDIALENKTNMFLIEEHLEELDRLRNGNSGIPGIQDSSIDEQLIKEIELDLKDLHFKQLEISHTFGYLKGFKDAESDYYDKPGGLVNTGELIRFVSLGMIGPFALSAIIEGIISFKRDKENDHASKLGLGFMILGFILVVLGMMSIVAQLGFETIL